MLATTQAQEEAERLRDCANGDRDAFEVLFRRYQQEVFGWVMRILHDCGLAEDATIETFWRIWRAHARFDARRGFSAWARRIASHVAFDCLEKRSREPAPLAATGEPSAPRESPDHLVDLAIRRAFHELPAKLQVAARLSLVEERSSAEIAEALGISVPAVKSRIFRAIRQLRITLRELEVVP
ncbi:MAG: sigma-70 family RNA polymerase sigma factor [Acidobacteria bacterium]|nr:sigma-70 family RNA polymerase sigma factor [Acidobacteriota bacterium]